MPKCIGCHIAEQNIQLEKLRKLREQQAADAAYDVFDLGYYD